MFSDEDRQRNLRSFKNRARLLLTDSERDYLHDVLKHYQTYKDVHRLMMSLRSSLDTPAKLDLLREIRGLIPPGHLRQFDEMAPYDKMAHPFHPPAGGDNQWRRMPSWHGRSGHSNPHSSDWIQSPNGMLSPIGDSRVITVEVDGEDIGFIIKGGAEQKMGIFVARVEPNSDAEMSGLLAGDQLLEVNNISFEVIPIHTASTVLRSTNRLKMKVFTPPKASSHKDTHRGNKWFGGTGTVKANIDKERTVLIQLDEDHQFIGFNIRGGSEYGLGVFVSRIDPGGLAELNGIKPGDQILEVNGQKLDNITHAQAVEIIRNQRNMIMRVRSTNKVPTYPRIEDNLPPPRSQSAVPSKSSSPPSSQDGSLKSAPVPNKDWLVRTEPTSDKGFKEDPKRPASAASSHSSKHSAKQVTGMGPSSAGSRDVHPPQQESSGGREAARQEHEPRTSTPTRRKPRAGEKKGRGLGRSFSMKVTGEKQRPMLDRDDIYQKREKKGKTLKQMLFGSKSKQREKQSVETVEEEDDANKSRDNSRTDEDLNESSGEKKGRKSRGKVHGLLNSFRRTREDVKVKRRTPLERQDSQEPDDGDLELSGNWATRKNTQEAPNKTADISSYGSIGKQRGLFVQGAGTQVMLATVTPPSNFAMLEDAARRVLNTDESKAVLRHLKRYVEEGDIDSLVVPLLAILDQPEKVLLLSEVRGFILPKDIVRFDALVSKKELDALKKVRKQEKEGLGATNSHRPLHQTQSAERYLENPNPSASGDNNFALYSHIPTMTVSLVDPEPIPVGPSEYVSIQTNDENNLARMKGKKVMISSDPEIIPRHDSYPDASSAELSPISGTMNQFTFGASEADVIARLNSALGESEKSKDENANSMLGHTVSTPPAVTTVQRDFRGGFTASATKRQNPLQTFSSKPNPYDDNNSEDSDSSSNAQKVGSCGFGGEVGQRDVPSPNRKHVHSPTHRPSLPPPPPPPLFANPPSIPPTFSNGVSGTGYPQSDPREPLYAKVDKSRRHTNPEQSSHPRVTMEAPYASISEFDRLSVTSGESDGRGSNSATPKKGILKNSFNNDFKRPNIEVRNPDVDDYEPSPLREISNEARRDDSLSFNLDVSWPSSPRGDSFRVELSKNNPSLGLSVSGGCDCKHQPSVKVDQIIPGGTAAEDGTLKVPYTLIGIDGRSLRNVTHDEAVDIIRQSYADKTVPYMSVEFLPTS